MIKVCIIDDNQELVININECLEQHDDIEVVGTAYNGIDGLDLIKESKPF